MLSAQDVLQPELINILGARYRKTPYRLSNDNYRNQDRRNDIYVEEDYYYDEPVTCTNQYDDIIKESNNGFVATIEDIPMFYFKFIVGKGGFTKGKIESETRCKIVLPPRGFDGDIVIKGVQKSDVVSAVERINTLIELNKREQTANHFLAIQLHPTNHGCADRMGEFKEKVLALKSRGIDESIFQFPERLHLTICLLIFLNQKDFKKSEAKISEIVQNAKQKHFGEEKIRLHLHGIEYMNDDPSEVDILYAKADLDSQNMSQSSLQGFVDEIVNRLVSSGHARKQSEHVKLHATIMNTLFRTERDKNPKIQRQKQRETFDARHIFKEYESFDFGYFDIKQLDISVRGRFDDDGHYISAGNIQL